MSDHGPDHSPPPPPPPFRPPAAYPPAPPAFPPVPPAFPAGPPRPPGPPSSPGPGAPSGDRGPSRGQIIGGIAVALVFALAAVIVAAVVSRDADDAALDTTSATSTTARTAPSTTAAAPSTTARAGGGTPSAPTTTTAGSDFERALDPIIAFVEKERGLAFKSRPVVIALSEADFLARFQKITDDDYQEYKADYEAATVVLSALGLLKNGVSYYDTTKAFGDAGVLGFYDPETKELSVRGSTLTPFVKTVVAHELTHALDDQWFDLDRPEYDDAKDEISFGLSAVAEGNARRVENAYRDTFTAAESAAADKEEASYGGGFQANSFTAGFLKLQLAPYTLGEAFVDDLLDLGGQESLDAAFKAPPTTSEEVLDVDKYLAKEGRADVAPPPADAAVVDDGVMGEIVIRYLLESVVSTAQASRAAAGWAGDWYVAWSADGASCVRMAVQMDTAADTNDLKSGFDRWAASRPKARVVVNARTVTVTSCTK